MNVDPEKCPWCRLVEDAATRGVHSLHMVPRSGVDVAATWNRFMEILQEDGPATSGCRITLTRAKVMRAAALMNRSLHSADWWSGGERRHAYGGDA